jgi:hypothetical protein
MASGSQTNAAEARLFGSELHSGDLLRALLCKGAPIVEPQGMIQRPKTESLDVKHFSKGPRLRLQ